ncbi:PREDICTED: zinc finger protein CONSTANS-LIKE 5-like [Tarenaya hassleriana]|uniref:zinc finger protein CONSTANS-LIKE 5-like n=1 Tax=Tarenaya hassleriana TaxID=28532 RepID=UPI00053C772C|nr:PREDICTED: zinc finger protein CONSTANS-LIKE 5-like [Tarenaya hassleriana]
MGIELDHAKGMPGDWRSAARPCDGCKSVAASVFCRVDSVFLCIACDSRIYSSSRHERVWVCQVCEQAPAAVTCKADAAALCVSCDSDIHSANPLASRHDRIPVEPFFDSAVAKLSSFLGNFTSSAAVDFPATTGHSDDLGVCPWLIPFDFNDNNKINIDTTAEMKSSDFVLSDFDRLIGFECPNSFHPPQNSGGSDSVVPVQTKPSHVSATNTDHCFDIDFCRSKLSALRYPTQSTSHSVSTSSLEFGVVPEGSTSLSEISIPFGRNVNGGSTATAGDPSPSLSVGTTNQQICGSDREARVSRYREKRKNRKFEKTIRYASRKAYAESRPRIKGRFAKRTEADNDNDIVLVGHVYASAAQYGVVPSF